MSAPASSPIAEQDWYFTFGSGQQFDGMYVVIAGTYDSARDEMLRHFGNAWSFQYASPERVGVEEFGLVELPRADWPQPYTVTFPDGFDNDPLVIAAAADESAIAAAVRDHLDPTGALCLGVLADLDAGVVHIDEQQATITCSDSADAKLGRLLAAVEQVIAAGQLDYDTSDDPDGEQGKAHAALIAAYQAVTR